MKKKKQTYLKEKMKTDDIKHIYVDSDFNPDEDLNWKPKRISELQNKYLSDPIYATFVNYLELLITNGTFTPFDMQEALPLACHHIIMRESEI